MNKYWVVATNTKKGYNRIGTRVFATNENSAKKIAKIELGENVKILSIRKED